MTSSPARPVPALPAHAFLDRLGIPYETAEFPISIEKGAASIAHNLGYRERQMVKTLIFAVEPGDCLLVMVGGDQSIISGNLKKVVGSRDIRMASPELVKRTTGYAVGSIPPFSWQTPGFRSFLEVSLMDESILGVGTGLWGHEILITPQNLVAACRARIVNLVDRNTPALLAEKY
jgi:Cys-tRNA(Pro)/Cys-tRNA(Cys) deacylase